MPQLITFAIVLEMLYGILKKWLETKCNDTPAFDIILAHTLNSTSSICSVVAGLIRGAFLIALQLQLAENE